MNVLEIEQVCKSYPGFYLDHLDLAVPEGSIVGLIGENGAGKSTTIKLILDLLKKDEGTIRIFGEEDREKITDLKNDIGVVLDTVGLPVMLKSGQIGKIMKDAFRNWNEEQFQTYLKMFDIPEDKKFYDMSNGTKMKLGLAIAFSHDAKLLILDEATNGLDPIMRDKVNDILMEFTRDEKHSVLISSHIVSDLEKLCDYIAFLHKGKLMLFEEKDILNEQYGIVHAEEDILSQIDPALIIHRKKTPYGDEAVVKKEGLPASVQASPIGIEDLFVIMSKEAGI